MLVLLIFIIYVILNSLYIAEQKKLVALRCEAEERRAECLLKEHCSELEARNSKI